jgi:hypothetical protein
MLALVELRGRGLCSPVVLILELDYLSVLVFVRWTMFAQRW